MQDTPTQALNPLKREQASGMTHAQSGSGLLFLREEELRVAQDMICLLYTSRSRLQLHRVLEGIQAEPGPVLCSLFDTALRGELDAACARLGVPLLHVLDPLLDLLQAQFGAPAKHKPGRQYVLDADYFRRIDAMHYVISHDDGQAHRGMAEACLLYTSLSTGYHFLPSSINF